MLKGKNVVIRPLEAADYELFYSWLQSQECLGEFMDMRLMSRERFLKIAEKNATDPKRFHAMIEDTDGRPIGQIDYIQALGSDSTLEVGVLIAEKSRRGRGLGAESLRLFTDYLFSAGSIMRIQFKTRSDNAAMIGAGEKAGYRREGILRKFRFEGGKYRDYCLMAVTREEDGQ